MMYVCVVPHYTKCDRCRPTFVLPKGQYDTKLSNHMLDIVQTRVGKWSGGNFITNANGPVYDWSVNYPNDGFHIIAETTSIPNPISSTIVIGTYAVRGQFRSFSLTDKLGEDANVFVMNKYINGDGYVGVCLSGWFHKCDYKENLVNRKLYKKKLAERSRVELVYLTEDRREVESDMESDAESSGGTEYEDCSEYENYEHGYVSINN